MPRSEENAVDPAGIGLPMVVGLCALMMFIVSNAGDGHSYAQSTYSSARADTITVEGQLVVVGNEPFTRLRLVEKGGGGYLLNEEDTEDIELRRQGPTEVRVVGIPYMDMWQGQEVRHLCVVRLVKLKIDD